MINQASKAIQRREYLSAILLAATASELYLKSVLDVPNQVSWPGVVSRAADVLRSRGRSAAEVNTAVARLGALRGARNTAAHPAPDFQPSAYQADQMMAHYHWIAVEFGSEPNPTTE